MCSLNEMYVIMRIAKFILFSQLKKYYSMCAANQRRRWLLRYVRWRVYGDVSVWRGLHDGRQLRDKMRTGRQWLGIRPAELQSVSL